MATRIDLEDGDAALVVRADGSRELLLSKQDDDADELAEANAAAALCWFLLGPEAATVRAVAQSAFDSALDAIPDDDESDESDESDDAPRVWN